MKQSKDYYRQQASHGYYWGGFWGGLHHFIKRLNSGLYAEIKASEEDLTNGNLIFFFENGLSR